MRKISRLILVLIIVQFLPACTATLPINSPGNLTAQPWRFADVRLLDPLDSTQTYRELIAVYTRLSGDDLEVRLDFLNSRDNFDGDIYLAIDYQPGGTNNLPINAVSALNWDALGIFQAGGVSRLAAPDGRSIPENPARIYRDFQMNSAVLRIRWRGLTALPASMAVQVWITPPAEIEVSDASEPAYLAAVPPSPAPLLIAFWNTLPAGTPAQLLRRWDGAHTGPLGHRHGLYQILMAVDQTNIPVTLLDLKHPDSLAGLDAVGGTSLVQKLVNRRLLLLPDLAYGDPQWMAEALQISRKTSTGIHLPASLVVFGDMVNIPQGYLAAFSTRTDIAITAAGVRLIPIPVSNEGDADPSGKLSETTVRQLLLSARSPHPQLTVLGGDLQNSLWADANISLPILQWISAHPWIHTMFETDLLTSEDVQQVGQILPPGCANLLCMPAPDAAQEEKRARLRTGLADLPDGQIKTLAAQSYLNLTRLQLDPRRAALQDRYIGQVGLLLAAGRWFAHPATQNNCTLDLDGDGKTECILSSNLLFLVLSPDGGRLVLAGLRRGTTFQLWTAPSSLFALGLGDPSEWHLDSGWNIDPGVMPGAFYEPKDPFIHYETYPQTGQITFRSPDGIEKRFSLEGDMLRVEYHTPGQVLVNITLAASAEQRAGLDWTKQFNLEVDEVKSQLRWGAENPVLVSFNGINSLQTATFLDSDPWMRQPEDPDHEYPPGHFLPYPLAQISIQAAGNFNITLQPDKK